MAGRYYVELGLQQRAEPLLVAVVIAVGVLAPVAAFLADKTTARSGDLDIEKVAGRLADLVRDQWDIEAGRRRRSGPYLCRAPPAGCDRMERTRVGHSMRRAG